jgi:hypothetical protein
MPTKKDLAALLSETPQQPLSRGRGLRLSRASQQARELAAKPSVASEPSTLPEQSAAPEPAAMAALPSVELTDAVAAPAAPTIAPDAAAAEADARVITPIESAALSASTPLTPERDKRKLLLRKDLLKQCKRIARAQDRKLSQVIESAMEEYIQRHGAPE